MREIKYIILGFENVTCSANLSVGDMDESDVNLINISGIEETIHTVACNSVMSRKKARNIDLTLNPSANNPIKDYGDGILLFERILACPDIVDITVGYDDGTEEEIWVPWDFDHSEYENSYQTARLSENGKLHIKIEQS